MSRKSAGFRRSASAALVAVLLNSPAAARAEKAQLFTVILPRLSSYPGATAPAKSQVPCYSFKENKCWTGKEWREVYPLGPRRYAKPPATGLVSCVVIMAESHDCWDGKEWYRLPPGTLTGTRGAPLDPDFGAFFTAPLR
jgi:hypothetical protein